MPAPGRLSRCLVIDASVARAAGDRPDGGQRSRLCGQFLERAREICHRLVLPPELRKEWRDHRSRLAHKWLVEMQKRGRHKVVEPKVLDPTLLAGLRNRITKAPASSQEQMTKDLFLITAALGTDEIIISLDPTARSLFADIALDFPPLRRVCWVSPEENDWQDWLLSGAPFREDLCLAHHARRR